MSGTEFSDWEQRERGGGQESVNKITAGAEADDNSVFEEMESLQTLTREGEGEETNTELSEVFKPKQSLSRTPPKPTDEEDNDMSERYTDKRMRELTPSKGEDEERLKRKKRGLRGEEKEGTAEDNMPKIQEVTLEELIKERKKEEEEKALKVKERAERERERERLLKEQQRKEKRDREERLKSSDQNLRREIRERLNRISKATSREEKGKLTFRREDQTAVREAVGDLTDAFMNIIDRMHEAEIELAGHKGKGIPDGRAEEDQELRRNEDKEEIRRILNDFQNKIKKEQEEREAAILMSMEEMKSLMLTGQVTAGGGSREKRIANKGGRTETDMDTTSNAGTTGYDPDDSQDSDANDKTSYARVTKGVKGAKLRQKRRTETYATKAQKSTKNWKTPEQPKKTESILRKKDCTEAREIMKDLTEKVTVNDLGGAPKSVRQTRSGAVWVSWKSEAHRIKGEETLKRIENLEIRTIKNNDPMFRITGISKQFTGEQVLEGIMDQNEDIRVKMGGRISEVKIITKNSCRNPWKNNWVFQAPADIFKVFVKKEIVDFDMEKIHIEEHTSLAICFRCARYGHVAKYCKDVPACTECAGEHEGNTCTKTDKTCVNCKRVGNSNQHHSARDPKCPTYQKKLSQQRLYTNYGA